MNRTLRGLAAGAIVAATAQMGAAQLVFFDNFEDGLVGQIPGGWTDTTSRIDNPTTGTPNARVINTIGSNGQLTKAVQLVDRVGTSQGIIREVDPTRIQKVQMDVRIDRYSSGPGWPGGMGFIKDMGADDLNSDPQAVIYAWTDRRWHFFAANGDQNRENAYDIIIPGLPLIELGRWYTLYVESDSLTGRHIAAVYDGFTKNLIGGTTFDVPNWDPQFGYYDAVAAYDGEPSTSTALSGGISTYDNVAYVPAPAGALAVSLGAFGMTRRRR